MEVMVIRFQITVTKNISSKIEKNFINTIGKIFSENLKKILGTYFDYNKNNRKSEKEILVLMEQLHSKLILLHLIKNM